MPSPERLGSLSTRLIDIASDLFGHADFAVAAGADVLEAASLIAKAPEETRAALRAMQAYTVHRVDCAIWIYGANRIVGAGTCDCGLDALRATVPQEQQS